MQTISFVGDCPTGRAIRISSPTRPVRYLVDAGDEFSAPIEIFDTDRNHYEAANECSGVEVVRNSLVLADIGNDGLSMQHAPAADAFGQRKLVAPPQRSDGVLFDIMAAVVFAENESYAVCAYETTNFRTYYLDCILGASGPREIFDGAEQFSAGVCRKLPERG